MGGKVAKIPFDTSSEIDLFFSEILSPVDSVLLLCKRCYDVGGIASIFPFGKFSTS